MKLLKRYYCTALDYVVGSSITALVVEFMNLNQLTPLVVFIFTCTILQFTGYSSMSIIYKHRLVSENGEKINFLFLLMRNTIKLLLIILFIFTSPISLIIYPFHTDWSDVKNSTIDSMFQTKVIPLSFDN